ncbi:GntR family transcriptional regulator [Nitratireductor kimnyeongensis]|uniref:GntR family transcriptional regulator n=1 Tax=Nitratireductor kimnyeongensis TaxID=430679 RepID=A0ABW0TA44_9HYPH|nr:GntR family transcriptional regulator [Nitratireductor kimnyeongensis]QZZ36573.1 GntR family transcriptional regulator [Nitratireductor kimnyeongensis]
MTSKRASFRTIRDELSRRIAERVWLPGTLIPGEEALAEEFGAARATVNRALQELARAGILERKRRAGTRVALHPVREARFVIPRIRQEIEGRGSEYQYRLLSAEEADAPEVICARLSLLSKANMLHVRCLHLADRVPYQFEDRWINLNTVPDARTADFTLMGPNEWLVGHAPFSNAEFTFMAGAASADEASLLQIREGDPVFIGERITWMKGEPITLAHLVHPSSHRMVTHL